MSEDDWDPWFVPHVDVPTVEWTDPEPILFGPDGAPIVWSDRPVGFRSRRLNPS